MQINALFNVGDVVWVLANGSAVEVTIVSVLTRSNAEGTQVDYEVQHETINPESIPSSHFSENRVGSTKADLLSKL